MAVDMDTIVLSSNIIICSFFLIFIGISQRNQQFAKLVFSAYLIMVIFLCMNIFYNLNNVRFETVDHSFLVLIHSGILLLSIFATRHSQKLSTPTVFLIAMFLAVIFLTIYFISLSTPHFSEFILPIIGFFAALYSLQILTAFLMQNEHHADIFAEFRINWLTNANYVLFFAWTAIFLLKILDYFLTISAPEAIADYVPSLVIYIVTLSYFVENKQSVNNHIDMLKSPPEPALPHKLDFFFPQFIEKYVRSSLKEKEVEEIEKKVNYWVHQQKLYLDPNLNLDLLSAKTGTPKHKLSQYFSRVLKQSFNNFINTKRVEAFKQKVADHKNNQFTLLALAYDAGFNSKSSFNLIFKKIAGITPKQYSDSLGNQKRPK